MHVKKHVIGEWIRDQRMQRGWRREDLVSRCESLSWGNLARIEQGKILNPHVRTLMQIAEAFGVTVNEVLTGKAPTPPPTLEQARQALEAAYQATDGATPDWQAAVARLEQMVRNAVRDRSADRSRIAGTAPRADRRRGG